MTLMKFGHFNTRNQQINKLNYRRKVYPDISTISNRKSKLQDLYFIKRS